MSLRRPPRFAFRKDKGFALIIVLFFVVLMTGLTVAYLARAITARRVSDSSTAQAKALLLAQTAGQITLLDLKQEIIDGSTSATYSTTTIYTPKPASATGPLASTVTPALTGFVPQYDSTTGVETDGLANLLKVSRNGVPFYSGGNYARTGVSRAANTDSTNTSDSTMTPSLNGRYVSPARWNSHYLLARASGASGNSSTPIDNFTQQGNHSKSLVPDWILVTRDGTNPVFPGAADLQKTNIPNYTDPTGGTIVDPTSTNNSYVIGRYAYAIYNEGGLLDMNVAGFPSTLTQAQIGTYKNTVAMADLTQLPATTPITKAQIDNIVAWRNNYTAQLNNQSYPNATFSTTSAGSWLTNFVQYNSNPTNQIVTVNNVKQVASANNYMGVNTNTLGGSSTTTDQAFLSRQQLISLTQALNVSPDVLQYLGTFSRSLEQPSYTPNPSRPTVLAGALPAASSASNYLGNNDATPSNNNGVPVDNLINPAFPSIRVTTPFIRWNGAQAIVGEPLIKTRFALSHLAIVAYNATNSTAKTAYATTADPDPILDRFGLTWDNTNHLWIYNHDPTSATPAHIMTLSQVASAGREPDFAELLKASITVGSLAKGGPNINVSGVKKYDFQFNLDTSVDLQVLQIMANLIDQQDKDSYPTRIQLAGNTSVISGIEDLPYIYRWHNMSLVDRVPKPAISFKDSIQFPKAAIDGVQSGNTPITISGGKGGTVSGTWRVNANNYVLYGAKMCELSEHRNGSGMPTSSTPYLTDPGEVTHLLVLDLWNPHDPNSLANEDLAKRPTQFRASATTQDPSGLSPQWSVSYHATFQDQGNSPQNSASADVFYGSSAAPAWNQNANTTLWTTSGTLPLLTTTPANPTGTPNTFLTFSDVNGTAFREPTLLWHNAGGIQLQGGGTSIPATVSTPPPQGLSGPQPSGMPADGLPDPVGGAANYFGFVAAQLPVSEQITFYSGDGGLHPTFDGVYICQLYQLALGDPGYNTMPVGGYGQITFTLEYKDANGNWIPYDWKNTDFSDLTPKKTTSPVVIVQPSDYPTGVTGWQNMVANKQIANHGSVVDPRTGRWGMQDHIDYTTTSLQALDGTTNFNVISTQDPGQDKGYFATMSNPTAAGSSLPMRWFNISNFYEGMMAFNNPALSITVNGLSSQQYYEDTDGIARRGMSAYSTPASIDANPSGAQLPTGNTAPGMPFATANGSYGAVIGTATQQSQSRPFILNRPFQSVEEMGYAFTGTPWKNINFFTPESGDAGLLDTFCVSEPPTNGIVAGKVDLNTRQEPVLQALEAGTYRDEANNATSQTPPNYASPPLKTAEAAAVAQALVKYTTFTPTSAIGWRGPFANISELVGKYVGTAPATAPDAYTYTTPSSVAPPVNASGTSLRTNTYAGFSAALSSNVFTAITSGNSSTATATTSIQRFREAALRPLVDVGQVRIWNLLIDIVAQTGRYPKAATSLDQFAVDGEKRIWLHVAIDRYTGQIIDKQVEIVSQ